MILRKMKFARGKYRFFRSELMGTFADPCGGNLYGELNIPTGYDFIDVEAGAYVSFALTPEPATLLILGLGGLMLRETIRNKYYIE